MLAASIRAVDYCPVKPRSEWAYSVVEDGKASTEHREVLAQTVRIGKVRTQEVRTDDGNQAFYSFAKDGSLLLHMESIDGNPERIFFTYSPAMTYIPNALQLNKIFSTSTSVRASAKGGTPMNGTAQYTLRALKYEKVKVPAGVFTCLKISRRFTWDGTNKNGTIEAESSETFWVAVGIGEVKCVSYSSIMAYDSKGNPVNHKTGERHTQLLSYYDGKRRVAAPRAVSEIALGSGARTTSIAHISSKAAFSTARGITDHVLGKRGEESNCNARFWCQGV